MITRYVLHITCSKNDSDGKPRRLLLTFLSAGGNNVTTPNGEYTHKLTHVLEGEECPEEAPTDAHTFIVTPTSYNEWVAKAERMCPNKRLWNNNYHTPNLN